MTKSLGRLLFPFALPLVSVLPSHSQIFEGSSFETSSGTLNYQILRPDTQKRETRYPLVLFLHGSGERGSDNQRQLLYVSDLFLDSKVREDFPSFVVIPQCSAEDAWMNYSSTTNQYNQRELLLTESNSPTKALKMVMELLDSLFESLPIDRDRVYVGGLSMGGMGTFDIIDRNPDVFAAAFPICGGHIPEHAGRYASKVNFWIFHGGKDNVVFSGQSTRMVQAIRRAGGEAKFTLYKDAAHDSWTPALKEPNLLPWLFSNRK